MRKDNKLQAFSTVVTSYEIVMRDRRFLQHIPWKYIVVDEGHRLKNLNCRLIRELKTYQSANRLLLTGTPLQVCHDEKNTPTSQLTPSLLHSFAPSLLHVQQ